MSAYDWYVDLDGADGLPSTATPTGNILQGSPASSGVYEYPKTNHEPPTPSSVDSLAAQATKSRPCSGSVVLHGVKSEKEGRQHVARNYRTWPTCPCHGVELRVCEAGMRVTLECAKYWSDS